MRVLIAALALLAWALPAAALPGAWVRHAFMLDGVVRYAHIYEPSTRTPGAPLPLILAFHGGGGDGLRFATEQTGLLAAAEAQGYVLVAMQGHGLISGWNYGGDMTDHQERGAKNDLAYVDRVMQIVTASYAVSEDRALVGASAGGMMSARVACESAWSFNALAVVVGTVNVPACPNAPGTAYLHIHGDSDDVVPFGGGAGAESPSGANFRPVTAGINDFLTAGNTVTLVLIPGGEHGWFTAPQFDATGAILTFLAAH